MTKLKPVSLPSVGKSTIDQPTDETQKKDGVVKPTLKELNASVVVFGRDDKNKAHASRFGEANREAAIKAAHLMGFRVLAIAHDVIRNIAEDLPEGRVFDSGKGFVPFVREGACLALEGHAKQFPRDIRELSASQIEALQKEMAEHSDERKAGKDDNAEAGIAHKSEPFAGWVDVSVGTIVLAVGDPDDGWWEARVTHAHKSGIGTNIITMLTLEWLNFPEDESFIRRSNEVAYFAAGYGQEEPANDDTANDTSDGKASNKEPNKETNKANSKTSGSAS
jgi:hypothetical protein